MKIFEKYNFKTENTIISKSEFRKLPFLDKDAFNIELFDKTIKKADEYLVKEIPQLTLSMYRAYNTLGSTSVYGSPYRTRMEMALCLAFAELYTGEGKYFDKMLDVVYAMLDEPTWMLPE